MGEFNPTFPQFRDDGNGSFTGLLNAGNPLAVFFICTKNVDSESLGLALLVEKLAAQYGGQVRFLWVDTGADENLRQRLGLNGLPTLTLFHKGREIARFTTLTSEPGIYYDLEGLANPHKSPDLEYIRRILPSTLQSA